MPQTSPSAADAATPSTADATATATEAAAATPTPTPGTKAALQEGLDAANARIAQLEAQLATATSRAASLEAELTTVTADRDAAATQLQFYAEPLRLGPDYEPTAHEIVGGATQLALRLVVATEVQAMLALAATRSGREASDLRTQAEHYLRSTIGHYNVRADLR